MFFLLGGRALLLGKPSKRAEIECTVLETNLGLENFIRNLLALSFFDL